MRCGLVREQAWAPRSGRRRSIGGGGGGGGKKKKRKIEIKPLCKFSAGGKRVGRFIDLLVVEVDIMECRCTLWRVVTFSRLNKATFLRWNGLSDISGEI